MLDIRSLSMSNLKMPDINNVLIAGNVTGEPTLRKTANGTPLVNFYLVSNRKYKDNSGIWRENLCHVGVVAWYKLAETCADVLKNGSTVLVDGELQSRNWRNDDGSSRTIVEIRARRIQFLEKGVARNVEEITYRDLSLQKTKKAEEQQKEKPDSDSSKKQHIESTEYDFGYQNLKL